MLETPCASAEKTTIEYAIVSVSENRNSMALNWRSIDSVVRPKTHYSPECAMRTHRRYGEVEHSKDKCDGGIRPGIYLR